MISINATLVLQVINFLVLLFILNRILFRPVLKTIRERSDKIEGTKKKIEEMEQKTEDYLRDYEEREDRAKREAHGKRAVMNQAGNQRAREIFGSAKEEITGLKKKGRADIEKEMEEARNYFSINRDAESLAQEITNKFIRGGKQG